MAIRHVAVADYQDSHAGGLITTRGKELTPASTVGEARELLTQRGVLLLPVLDAGRLLGAVTAGSLPADAAGDEPVLPYTRPTASVTASTPLWEALAVLGDADVGRLTVVADDGATYVGLLCLKRDRTALCVDARRLEPGDGA